MPRTEQFFSTMPESMPTFTEGARIDPNDGSFPHDATIHVTAENDQFFTFKILPKGPAEDDYLISMVESDPPIYSAPLYDKEVYVKGDVLKKGYEFVLDSALPILSQTAFKAMQIFTNVQRVNLPNMDDTVDAILDDQEPNASL